MPRKMLLVEIHLAPSLSFAMHLSDQNWIMEVSRTADCLLPCFDLSAEKQLILRWAELWQKPSQYTSLLRLASLQIYNLVSDLELDHSLGPCAERWEIGHFLRKSLYCSAETVPSTNNSKKSKHGFKLLWEEYTGSQSLEEYSTVPKTRQDKSE